MPTIEQRLQHLEDESAIRELAARFADATTRADYDTLRSIFKPDAVFRIGEPNAVTCNGVDAIVEFVGKLRNGKDFFVQFVHSGLIQIHGNTASARWQIREVALVSGKTYYNNFGFFNDEMEKVEGTWFFTSRTYQYLYLDTDPFTGKAVAFDAEMSFT